MGNSEADRARCGSDICTHCDIRWQIMDLKTLRKEKGLTVQQLSDKAGLSKRTVEDIIRRDDCLVSNAIKLADALGVTLDELCRTNSENE